MANSLNQEVEGKYVIAHGKVWLCTGGFGTSPNTGGNAIFATDVATGESARLSGYNLKRLATDLEVAQATQLKNGGAQ